MNDRRRRSARAIDRAPAPAAAPQPGGIMRGEDGTGPDPVRTNSFQQLVRCLRVRGERRHDEVQVGEEDRTTIAKDAAATTNVSMELDVLDCPICSEPLRPPVFQVCSCRVPFLVVESCSHALLLPYVCAGVWLDRGPARCELGTCRPTSGLLARRESIVAVGRRLAVHRPEFIKNINSICVTK